MVARSWTRITPIVALLALATVCGGPSWAAQKKKAPSAAPAQAAKPPPVKPLPAEAFSLTPGYVVKPSDVAIPSDVPIGQYRRTIRPFPNWTLICDENLVKQQRVCNISQTITGPGGVTVFSWSLAAAADGQPLFILRAPVEIGDGGAIEIRIPDGGPSVPVPVVGCNGQVCLAYQPVGQRLRNAVEQKLAVQISYAEGSPAALVSFRAPFDGLATALAAI